MPGLDVLKYVMALLIIAGHSNLFEEWGSLYAAFAHITEIAVPTFFAISAYLFFSKLEAMPNDANNIFKHTMRRLMIFFVIWYVLMLPYSMLNRMILIIHGLLLLLLLDQQIVKFVVYSRCL